MFVRGMGAERSNVIPLTIIPLTMLFLMTRSKNKTAGRKMGAKKSPVLYFCPHLFACLFSFAPPRSLSEFWNLPGASQGQALSGAGLALR
jgi:hypothetical protein